VESDFEKSKLPGTPKGPVGQRFLQIRRTQRYNQQEIPKRIIRRKNLPKKRFLKETKTQLPEKKQFLSVSADKTQEITTHNSKINVTFLSPNTIKVTRTPLKQQENKNSWNSQTIGAKTLKEGRPFINPVRRPDSDKKKKVVPDENNALIPAPNRHAVMEWSLVLTSQRMESTILHPDKGHWYLMVEKNIYDKAKETIHLYLFENRYWGKTYAIREPDQLFNWGSLYWVIPVAFVYLLNVLSLGRLNHCGLMDSDKVLLSGEWWRIITAQFIHADVGHLASNLTLGFPLLGVAMARFGIGWSLWTALCAGIAGNILSLLLHPAGHASLGASGVVMGVLGILSIFTLPLITKGTLPARVAFTALAASTMVFIMTGLSPDPQVNLSAHIGGYIGGICTGALLHKIPEFIQKHTLTNVLLTILWFAFCSFTWHLALSAH